MYSNVKLEMVSVIQYMEMFYFSVAKWRSFARIQLKMSQNRLNMTESMLYVWSLFDIHLFPLRTILHRERLSTANPCHFPARSELTLG